MITVKNLYHDYTGKGTHAVNDVSFVIEKGRIFGFLGPSGAGKSTVQNIMTGLLPLQQGEVRYGSTSVKDLKPAFFNRVGVSFELPNLYTKLTGYENLKYFAGLFSVPTRDPMELLDMVGLKDSAHKRTGAYSKGMKQRLVFARALLNKPEILFLDEPTSGLDPSTAGRIKEIILDMKERGCTILLTTHNMFDAERLCDNVAFINEGIIVAMDSPRELKLKYGEKTVKVEHQVNGAVKTAVLFLENEADRNQLNKLVAEGKVQTIHSQEATLEQIFIKLTGRELA